MINKVGSMKHIFNWLLLNKNLFSSPTVAEVTDYSLESKRGGHTSRGGHRQKTDLQHQQRSKVRALHLSDVRHSGVRSPWLKKTPDSHKAAMKMGKYSEQLALHRRNRSSRV